MKGIILLLFLAYSITAQSQHILEKLDFGKEINLSEVAIIEAENDCSFEPVSFLIGLGIDYYPNTKQYNLLNPIVANCQPETGLHSTAEYYFSEDSIVRAVLTTWVLPKAVTTGISKDDALIANKLAFQDKLTELQNILITQLGQPYVAGEHFPYYEQAGSERIDYKWRGKYNAYLSVVFSKDAGYSRLRLVIYQD